LKVKSAGEKTQHSKDEGETKMISRFNALYLSASLALSIFMSTPVMAGESNKKTEFQFSSPVEIPGRVLTPGKYVFQLLDDDANRNVVQVFSEDSDGNQSLIATVSAIPDYTSETPDKPLIHFEERPSGSPEAIHSWFYPGENFGWEFVYPKGQNLEANANTTPNPAPVTDAAAPSMPPATPKTDVQQVAQKEPAPSNPGVEERILVVQNEAPAQLPVQGTDIQGSAPQVLPQTGGSADLELLIGFAMLGSGLVAALAVRHKSNGVN
jgi:hypothetical protein